MLVEAGMVVNKEMEWEDIEVRRRIGSEFSFLV